MKHQHSMLILRVELLTVVILSDSLCIERSDQLCALGASQQNPRPEAQAED